MTAPLDAGVVMADSRGLITFVNREIESLFGYARDELAGRPVEMLFPRRSLGRRADSTEFPVEVSRSSIDTPTGVYVLWWVKEAGTGASAELAALTELSRVTAHDLNNMLGVITGCCQLLLHQLPEDAPIRADVADIHEAANRAAELTRKLRDFVKQ